MRHGVVASVAVVILIAGSPRLTTGEANKPTTITKARDGSVMVLVPAGAFLRGSAEGTGRKEEEPQRRIHLDQFFIDKCEVSVAQYRKCVAAGRCTAPQPGDDCNWGETKVDHPINCVDWHQATSYCVWAGKRLPTEAEWEKAARGTDGRQYPWGNADPDCRRTNYCNAFRTCCNNGTVPVAWSGNGASPYGAVQMAGNVWEWVSDWYDKGYYGQSPTRNPPGPSSGTQRVIRGGAWDQNEYRMRTAFRASNRPTQRYYYVGFRCSRTK